MFQKMMNNFADKPRTLFLFDAFGALLSAFFLGIILVQFETYFGVPVPVLYYLTFGALLLATYSFSCSRLVKKNWSSFLKVIALANLLYCGVTIGLMFYFEHQLTSLGIIYFIGEIILVVAVAAIELKTAFKLNAGT